MRMNERFGMNLRSGLLLLALVATQVLVANDGAYIGPPELPRSRAMQQLISSSDRGWLLQVARLENRWKGIFADWVRSSPNDEEVETIAYDLQKLCVKEADSRVNMLPTRFNQIILDNRKNYTPLARSSSEMAQTRLKHFSYLYESPFFFSVRFKPNSIRDLRLYWHNVWDLSQMAVFEKEADMPTLIEIPEKDMKTFSPEAQAYAKELLEVVNENLGYIGYIPFYHPQQPKLEPSRATVSEIVKNLEDAAGRIIPEKYLLTGKTLERVVKDRENPMLLFEPIDLSHVELQKRLGHPVYRLSAYEYHAQFPTYSHLMWHVGADAANKILDESQSGHLTPNNDWPFTRYENMRYVDSIVQLQVPMPELLPLSMSIFTQIRAVQYERAKKSLMTLQNGLKQEFDLQKDNEEKKKIVSFVFNKTKRLIQKWTRILDVALRDDLVLFNLVSPKRELPETRSEFYNVLKNTRGEPATPSILSILFLYKTDVQELQKRAPRN